MRRLIVKAAGLAAVVLASQPAPAGAGTLRASCTEGSQLVYREDIPSDAAQRRAQIIARNPNAMCVFLELQEHGGMSAGTPPGPGMSRLPDAIVSAAAGRSSLADAELSAALSAIKGGMPGEPYGLPSAQTARPAAPSASTAAGRGAATADGGIGLTIGLYRDVPVPVVMEHWKQVAAGSRILARMTPTITSADDVTTLSVEGVADAEVGDLCQEAQDRGMGCIAAY